VTMWLLYNKRRLFCQVTLLTTTLTTCITILFSNLPRSPHAICAFLCNFPRRLHYYHYYHHHHLQKAKRRFNQPLSAGMLVIQFARHLVRALASKLELSDGIRRHVAHQFDNDVLEFAIACFQPICFVYKLKVLLNI
jgi:hypothetical protein